MNNGKIIFAKNLDISTSNVKAVNYVEENFADGDQVKPNFKELGHSDFYCIGLKHSPNGYSGFENFS